jgi:hypothetical protein
MKRFTRLSLKVGAFLVISIAVIYRRKITGFLGGLPDPLIDLLLYVGGGLITAFVGILGGHVATEKRRYRWTFYLSGVALAAIIIASGIRNYRATLAAVQPAEIVMKAVNKANEHTDQAVERATQHTDEQVTMVRNDLKDVTGHSDQQIGMVRGDLKGAMDALHNMETGLTASISKVGKPDPPIPPQLLFSLWSEDPKAASPLLASSLRPNKDGLFTVDFSIGNNSHSAARSIDIWIDVCDDCSFAKEPDGFDRPTGMRDQTRHRVASLLNPGASLPKLTVEVKLSKPFTSFEIGMRYSCEICEKMADTQVARIAVLPATL